MMPIGRPPLLTPAMIESIAADIERGCYATVAAARAGIGHYTFYLWNKRGEHEAQEREQRDGGDGAPLDTSPSLYEQFYRRLEQAKATARYSAETRVFDTQPTYWLKNGYPRADWREADTYVRVVEDAVAQRLAALFETASKATVFDDDPETIRRVLQILIESGAALPLSAEGAEPVERHLLDDGLGEGPAR
jgi:hypothetical protein